MNEKKESLRVTTVGGSITGLTLAHSLYHSDIDFVVLESYSKVAPQVGASIAILPNGARILDQLDIFDDIFAMVKPLANVLSWTRDGRNFVNRDAPALAEARYPQPT